MIFIVTGSKVLDDNNVEYEVLDLIGSGGFGTVFKIKRTDDGTLFALKTLQIGFSQKEYIDSFRHEGEIAVKINSINVLKYLFFHDGDLYEDYPPYIIMEFAPEGSLLDLIEDQKGFFNNLKIISMFKELINGMRAINEKIIHRDLKPANILIANNTLTITDFGLSKITEDDTRTSTFKGSGTLSYMSPEAWRLEKNTILMDIYSMGLIFYEIATLEHPFKDEIIRTSEDWKSLHLFKNPKNPDLINSNLSPIIVQLIQKMIAKSPSERYNNWDEIEEFLNKENLPETESSPIIGEILTKKTKADYDKTQKRLKKKAREKEKEDKKELVQYVFENKIIIPLKDFVEELNSKLTNDKIKFEFYSLNCSIYLHNGNNISIDCSVIYEEDFYKEKKLKLFRGIKYKKELHMPKLRDKNIIAWGIIKSSLQKGYNFILIEKENDPYGELILLTNKNQAIMPRYHKVEPFELDYKELEDTLPLINALSQIDMKDEAFNLDIIYELVKDNFD